MEVYRPVMPSHTSEEKLMSGKITQILHAVEHTYLPDDSTAKAPGLRYFSLSFANFIQPTVEITRRVRESSSFILLGTIFGIIMGNFNVAYYFLLLNLWICLSMSILVWFFMPAKRSKLPFAFSDNTAVPKMLGYLVYPVLARGLDMLVFWSFSADNTRFRDIALVMVGFEVMLKTFEVLGGLGIQSALEIGRYVPDLKSFLAKELQRYLEMLLKRFSKHSKEIE